MAQGPHDEAHIWGQNDFSDVSFGGDLQFSFAGDHSNPPSAFPQSYDAHALGYYPAADHSLPQGQQQRVGEYLQLQQSDHPQSHGPPTGHLRPLAPNSSAPLLPASQNFTTPNPSSLMTGQGTETGRYFYGQNGINPDLNTQDVGQSYSLPRHDVEFRSDVNYNNIQPQSDSASSASRVYSQDGSTLRPVYQSHMSPSFSGVATPTSRVESQQYPQLQQYAFHQQTVANSNYAPNGSFIQSQYSHSPAPSRGTTTPTNDWPRPQAGYQGQGYQPMPSHLAPINRVLTPKSQENRPVSLSPAFVGVQTTLSSEQLIDPSQPSHGQVQPGLQNANKQSLPLPTVNQPGSQQIRREAGVDGVRAQSHAMVTNAVARNQGAAPLPTTIIPRVLGATDVQRNRAATGTAYASFGIPREYPKPTRVSDFRADVKPELAARFGRPQDADQRLPIKIYARCSNANDAEMASLDRELRQLIQAKDLTWDQYKNKIKRPQQRGAGSAVAISQSLDEPDEGDEDPDTPARSETRPEDPAEAAYWDAWGIVDIDRFGTRDATGIATAVAEYGKLIRTLSEQMSVEKKKLKQADQAGREADVIRLKDDVALRQLALQKAFEAGEEFGDPQVLANLGGNKKLVSDLVTALIHAYNSSDFTGPFAKSVLRLMAHITTITHELLFVSLRFKPIHKKFLAKGDEEVKALVDEIVANAESRSEAVSKSNNEGGSTDAKSSTPDPTNSLTSQTKMAITSDPKKMAAVEIAKQKSSGAGARVPSDSSPSKRPRDDEPDSRNVKKVAVESATGGAPQPTKVAAPKAVPNGTNQATQPKRWAGTGLLPGKSRPVAKPVSKVGSNKPDSSKPEPPKTPAAASTKREVPKTTSSKPEPPKNRKSESDKSEPPSSGRSVLGALLEEIAKPKKAPPPAPTPDSSSEISETPEEKERRLRKEKRRKLRVTWKEDLTQVRVFHKDDAEDDEINSMVPGARDERSEGLSLKRGHEEGIKLDEDEDDDPPYRPWEAPNPIDFSVIPNEKRQKSFVTRGGVLEFETDQQKFIRERESREIMAYYEHPSQIPPTPRSPRPVPEKEPALPAAQGAYLLSSTPQLQEIHRRWKDVDQSGLMKALRNALERGETSGTRSGAGHVPSKIVDPAAVLTGLGTLASSSQQAALPYSEQRGLPQDVLARQQLTSLSRDDQVLELLRRVKSWKDPEPSQPRTLRRHDYPDVKLQQAADAVEEIAEMLKGRPFPPTEPPEWLKEDATRMAEWWHGYTRDKQREAQRLQEGQSLSTMQVSQPAQPASVQQAATSAQDSNTAAWMAYYAQLSQAQPQQQNPYAQYYATYTAQAKPSQQPTPAQLSADPNSQLQALLATLGSGPQSTQHTSAPSGVTDPQLQALLASMAATPQAAPAMNASNPSDPAYQAYMLALAQYAAGQQQPSNGDSNGASAQTHEQQSRQQKGQTSNPRSGSSSRGDKSSSSSIPPHLRGINREKIGTKPCVFWANGTCNKGDKCTFRHD